MKEDLILYTDTVPVIEGISLVIKTNIHMITVELTDESENYLVNQVTTAAELYLKSVINETIENVKTRFNNSANLKLISTNIRYLLIFKVTENLIETCLDESMHTVPSDNLKNRLNAYHFNIVKNIEKSTAYLKILDELSSRK